VSATASTTSPGAPDEKDLLEQEIEATRDALVDTVDAIVERVDPAKVKDRTTEQLRRDVHRAKATAQERAVEIRQQAVAYVEQDRERAMALAGGAVAVLLLAWVVGRRQHG
jgi:N-acetylglucosamine kinase-like BadF-type ATPase